MGSITRRRLNVHCKVSFMPFYSFSVEIKTILSTATISYHSIRGQVNIFNQAMTANNINSSSVNVLLLKAMRWSVLVKWLRYHRVNWINNDNMIVCEINTNEANYKQECTHQKFCVSADKTRSCKELQNDAAYSKEQSRKQTLVMGTEVEQRSEEHFQSWPSSFYGTQSHIQPFLSKISISGENWNDAEV